MLSLDKMHTEHEIEEFFTKDVVVMWKADGLSISATYIDGTLTRLETRGDGKVGNDIMFHANSIHNLPKRINKSGKYVIDGECVILYSDFENINSKMIESERYSNPRNLAAGSLNLLDSSESAKRCLRFYAWDVIEGGNSNYLEDNLEEAEILGFDVVYHALLEPEDDYDLKEINDMIRGNAEINKFPIDGVVYKYNDIKYGKSLGMTDHHPRSAIAFKYHDDTYPTRLKSVAWQVGKNQTINPVAIFEPINIDGTMVERASLSNLTVMKKILGKPYVGQTIYVKKSNMIIPQIAYAEKECSYE
jgi:DNA ligase (NAD+)